MIDINNALPAPPPHARWISVAARTLFDTLGELPPAPADSLDSRRAYYDEINTARLDRALRLYPAAVSWDEIAGVPVHVIEPGNPTRGTLLCLHGGAFLWGSGAGAILEAVPVAATTGMRVIAVDYRLAPEHRFPKAVEDVLAVLSALRSESDEGFGIYGCSAGAVLTAQVVARLLADGSAPPQAIAMLHGSGVEVGGDLLLLAGQLNGTPNAADIQRMHDLPYFAGSDPADPMVFPGEHLDLLAAFPPALLITGTRDFAASSAAVMHRRLKAVGVEAEFVLFDGMWHAHHVDVELPESAETYALLAQFFRRHVSGA